MKNLTKTLLSIALFSTLSIQGRAEALTNNPFGPLHPDQVPSGLDYSYSPPPILAPTALLGKRVAILASHGVEELEITAPYQYLTAQGAQVDIIVPSWSAQGIVVSRFLKPFLFTKATATFAQALRIQYDLIVLTGGAWNAQVVRTDQDALQLIYNHYRSGRPIGAICAGTAILINAGLVRNLAMTGSPTVQIDLINAGARFVDQSLVIDRNIATSRSPADAADFVVGLRYLLIGQ